jgi:spermidine synthase
MTNNRLLYGVVFISGMTTLALELSASRLLGNVFGTSNLVWANVIGLMLLYLAIGYFIGGRWADRSPYPTTLYKIIVWGAFLSALIPLIARPILQGAAVAFSNLEAALAVASFVSVLILFSIPVTLLGTVSPFVIRLAVTDVQTAGKTSGQIYALSTFGSILGTFLPTLFTIPEFGTTLTFLFFAGILFVVGWAGLWAMNGKKALWYLWMPLAIALFALLSPTSALRAPYRNNTLLFDDDSAYNYIQVQEDQNGYRYLYLNEGQGIHSQWHPTQIAYQRTWDFFLSAPYFNDSFALSDMQSLLVIGLATGTIPRQHIAVYGNISIDGIEIDPEIIRVGAQYFDMNREKMPSLNAIAQDGRYALRNLSQPYTVIGIDAYRPPYIPWHLTTVEFFQEVKSHLAKNGVVVINVGRTNTDRRLIDALTNTLLQVFPSVHAMDVPSSFNTILVATQTPTSDANLRQNFANLPTDANPILKNTLELAQNSLVPTGSSDILFTDDRAPVETLIDSLVLNFLLNDGTDILR